LALIAWCEKWRKRSPLNGRQLSPTYHSPPQASRRQIAPALPSLERDGIFRVSCAFGDHGLKSSIYSPSTAVSTRSTLADQTPAGKLCADPFHFVTKLKDFSLKYCVIPLGPARGAAARPWRNFAALRLPNRGSSSTGAIEKGRGFELSIERVTASSDNRRKATKGATALLRLAPLLFLAACGPSSEQEQDMAQCRNQALKGSSSADGVERSCMVRKGYHFMAVLKDCGGVDPYGNAGCYAR
jgi:hypothetical protein